MDERNARLRERNRKRRGKKGGLNLKFAIDFLYVAAVALVIAGWAAKLPVLYLIAGIAMLTGSLYYIYTGFMAFKTQPKKSPEYKDALISLIFFSAMAVISILVIIFGSTAL